MTGGENLTYVYAVVADSPELRTVLSGVHGVSGSPVSLLGEDTPATTPAGPAPAFVISRVTAREYDERTLKARFEDLEWLEAVARAHHEVVQTIARHDTVLPLRLATLYQDDDRAREALTARRSVFAERLALLRGRSEWGVKVYVSSAGPPEDGAAVGPASTTTLGPGKAYLRRRRAQHTVQETHYRNAQAAAENIEALAARYTTHRVRHPAQRGALAGPEENVLNDAYLVPDDRAQSFRVALAAVAVDIDGVRVEVTGPWAPYSFAMPPPPSDPPQEDAARDGPAP
ncbi:gas vesicle protein [Streptomyces venezuelae]|uniref:GvpL/GvpF family gas vesicle protein n=1 Tax=Streptomyces venezuelae TaxID=54571 RepID=UPI00123E3627|nr:GvpL/GvpF family gas vesicle protein [Streptomyces venezuelae]QES11467.1 gas vesicle protein [Streptomyces venezuelae]